MPKTSKTTWSMDMGVPGAAGFMTALNPVAAKAWVDLMSEQTQFVTDQINRTVTLQQELMTCRSPADMMTLQSAYLRDTMEQYSAEMSKITGLMLSSFGAISKDAQSGHRRSYDDVPV